jgi:hypothetical protein
MYIYIYIASGFLCEYFLSQNKSSGIRNKVIKDKYIQYVHFFIFLSFKFKSFA